MIFFLNWNRKKEKRTEQIFPFDRRRTKAVLFSIGILLELRQKTFPKDPKQSWINFLSQSSWIFIGTEQKKSVFLIDNSVLWRKNQLRTEWKMQVQIKPNHLQSFYPCVVSRSIHHNPVINFSPNRLFHSMYKKRKKQSQPSVE